MVTTEGRETVLDVIVGTEQLSLAIGKEGQNARLAARLSGYRIDIRSESQDLGLDIEDLEEAVPGEAVEEAVLNALVAAEDMTTLRPPGKVCRALAPARKLLFVNPARVFLAGADYAVLQFRHQLAERARSPGDAGTAPRDQ